MEASQPKKGRSQKLSPEAKEWAKARAKRAGRPYPNLVDNMKTAERERSRKMKQRKSKSQPTKDTHGGLTAAGRSAFKRSQGATMRDL